LRGVCRDPAEHSKIMERALERKERSTCVVEILSGQLEKRVTSGAANNAPNAGTSFAVAARNVRRLVDKTGNFRLAVGGMDSLPLDFALRILRTTRLNCR
jgi:hypothetical protein